jgi:hypothetical protein
MSDSLENLDTFLADQQTGVFDSTGEFTIAADKALEKLGRSQLPEPCFWILKMAQFATASRVREMQVSIRRGYCQVRVSLRAPVHLEDFGSALSSTKSLTDRALNHLVTALRAIGGMTERRFALELSSGNYRDYLLWDGQQLSTTQKEGENKGPELCLEVALPNRGALETMAQALGSVLREGEAKVLMEQAYSAPLAIKLGKYQIEQFRRDSIELWFETLFWDSLRSQNGIRLPPYLNRVSNSGTTVSAYWCVNYYYELLHKQLAPSPTPKPLYRSSIVHWLRDGVVVKKELLKGAGSPYSLDLYVDATELPTDLGGLSFRLCDEFVRKRVWVQQLLKLIAQKTPERIQSFEKLSGVELSAWEATVTSTKLLPLNSPVCYKSRTRTAQKLQCLPGFRKKLLQSVKAGPFPFGSLGLNKMP